MVHIPEALLGSYMITVILVTKGGFEDKVLDSLLEAVIRSQAPETLESCLMCAAVIAEERSRPRFPAPVTRRVLKISNLVKTLQALSAKCRVDRVALGSALGALDHLGRADSLSLFQDIMDSKLLNDSYTSICLSALLQLIRDSSLGSAQHGQLIDLASSLGESPQTARMLRALVKEHSAEFESLGLSLQNTIEPAKAEEFVSEDEDMLDVDTDMNGAVSIAPPEITASSFLDGSSSESFQATLAAFAQVVAVSPRASTFLNSAELKQQEASKKPLFLSFLARTWCSPTSAAVKVSALRAATSSIRKLDEKTDFQHLFPYLLCALADASSAVRRASAGCISVLSGKANAGDIWASSTLYGASHKLSPLPKGQTSSLLSSVLIPILEECVMDSKFAITSIRNLIEGAQISKVHQGHNLKSAAKTALVTFLASHIASTPLLRVRLCLLPIFNFASKTTSGARVSTLLPVVRGWCSLSTSEVAARCSSEDVNVSDADKEHLAALLARESESVDILKEVLSGSINKERAELVNLAFERLVSIWPSFKTEARLSLAHFLLDLGTKQDCASTVEEVSRARSLETLRHVKLDTAVLLDLVESVPAAIEMPEGPPAKRRRRASRNEMARVEVQSPDDVTKLVRRLTLVLELVEGSNPGEHTSLFKNLFATLSDLQPLKQQSGSELVYLQSLVLGSLTPMVNELKNNRDASEYQAAVRVDLLIDIIRHSNSPQVQNAALLLIATLASWVPEVVLHNLMPIFTFISSTLLRQTDDYSAHVVDQTISRVVPQLAASLRAKHKNLLTGVSDLLLSFTAAFEHIPQHRRMKLFSELARTLGPEDSLSAIIALLVDRYPTSTAQEKFVPELLLQFEPMVTLETFKGYLGLVADAVGAKRNVSDTLFSLNEKKPAQVENTVNGLLAALAELATNKALQSHINKAFRKCRDPSKPRAIFADIVETTIRLSKDVTQSKRLYEACSRVLAKCLDLLPTADLIRTAELLLSNPDHQVAIAVVKSIEIRAGNVTQNDQQSVDSLLSFLPRVDELLQSDDVNVKIVAISCIDRIVERFGKKDTSAVASVARTISGAQSLSSNDDRVRILSLLCLTSVVDVLVDEAISLLPIILPTAFKYLQEGIEEEKNGLHNAVFSLLSNIVERLAYVFTREYMVPALELAQRSAASDLDEVCDEHREQFYKSVANNLGAQEAFVAIKATWSSAISHGYEATRDHLDLLHSTIEHQPKSKLIKTSSTLFGLFLEFFNLRRAVAVLDTEEPLGDAEIGYLESLLIESVIAMTLKLNDATFRPFFVQLVDSASTTADGEEDTERSITLCNFLATFFDRFKSIVTSYSSYIIDHLSHLLNHLVTSSDSSPLRKAVLSALHNSFEHDQDSFWQAPSHYGVVLEPLLKQLTVDYPADDTPLILTESVIPAIIELAAASSSSIDNHRQMNGVLLKYMRSEDAHTRLATVKCEQSLTKRLGEEWLALLPEMLPFISELREDDDEMVERETQRWISMVEEILGEDLEGMLQ
jgi:U3 small nucleolar RNA-associated protein 10